MSRLITFFIIVSCLSTWSFGQGIRVRHDHDPWGSCQGELLIFATGIEFTSEKEDHSRQWTWDDIQTVDRFSSQKFTVMTYNDQKLLLGRDQPFDFIVLRGDGLTDNTFELIQDNLTRPVVDRTADELDKTRYQIEVKHLHTFEGCEGILRFGTREIVYETEHQEDSRTWRIDQEVAGIWSTNHYDLEIQVYERNGGDFHRTRNFRFQLKKPLDREFYMKLRRELHVPGIR